MTSNVIARTSDGDRRVIGTASGEAEATSIVCEHLSPRGTTMTITIKTRCSVEDQHGDEIAVLNPGERITYLAHVPGGMLRVRLGDYADMAPVGIIHPAATVELS